MDLSAEAACNPTLIRRYVCMCPFSGQRRRCAYSALAQALRVIQIKWQISGGAYLHGSIRTHHMIGGYTNGRPLMTTHIRTSSHTVWSNLASESPRWDGVSTRYFPIPNSHFPTFPELTRKLFSRARPHVPTPSK